MRRILFIAILFLMPFLFGKIINKIKIIGISVRIYLFPVILQQMLSEVSDIAFKSN